MQRDMLVPPDPRIVALRAALSNLPPRDRQFALSLLSQEGRLSPKQLGFVVELAARAKQPAPSPVQLGRSFAGVVELLDRAAEKLKWPKLLVRIDGKGYRLTRAGERSSVPGSINVCDLGKGEERVWFGRVTREGEFEPSRKLPAETATAMAKVLRALAENPVAVAKAYGVEMGACCFCGLELTDKRSVAAGYGQICAGKWGLPWGE